MAVRYRKDECQQRTLTTIELIVDERPLINASFNQQGFLAQRNGEAVAVQIDFDELKLRVAAKGGGRTVESMWSIMGDALRRCDKTWFGFKNCY